ncbi:TIGR02678 family protein [Peptococcaceae bacterium 1198_IL3148]
MRIDKRSHKFDDTAKEAAENLLEQFWIIRDKEPDKYQMVREREQVLRTYFLEKMGFRLILHRYFAKLEKIPAEPESWMGLQSFKHTRDYVLFCCLLAYLEGKTVDEQFLLSDLCEDLQGLYPEAESLDWTHYEHRKSLVRVLQFAAEIDIIKMVDGDINGFNYAENSEVLYEVPLLARYFMRSFPKDLLQFKTKEQILQAEWLGNEENIGAIRRHRVYRQLFLSPVIYSKNPDDADFLYLRNYRHRIREDIEKHTDYQFELYKNTALLTLNERKVRFELFPDNRAIADIALQFAALSREFQQLKELPLQPDGSIYLTPVEYQNWVVLLKERYGAGWSKQYRENNIESTASELLDLLVEWKMAMVDVETGVIYLQPLLVRTVGHYPKDFKPNTSKEGVNSEGE